MSRICTCCWVSSWTRWRGKSEIGLPRPPARTLPTASVLPDWAVKSDVARLATVDAARPHVVPVVFCELDGALYIPVDGKPKSGARLKRLRNIERNPAVALLVDR